MRHLAWLTLSVISLGACTVGPDFQRPHTPHEALPGDKALYASLPEAAQNYYGELTGIDRNVGKLRAALRELKVSDNTLLWYTSDNGGAAGPKSTGELSHACNLSPDAALRLMRAAESLQLVDAVADCELLQGLPCHLVHVGARNPDIQAEMSQAAQRLADAGFSTHIVIESGDVAQVLGRHLTIQQLPLLVMSAFTHNGWRQKLLGTTTSTLLRRIPTSVLVLR